MMRASRRRGVTVIAALAAGAVAAPAASGAPAPFAVQVGGFDPPRAADLQAFYPRNAVIREGDSLTFRIQGFHTVTFPARGQRPPALLVPTGTPAAAKNDAAGAPYWWAGRSLLAFNPAAGAPTASRRVTGRQLVNSGVGGPNFTVTFPRRGTYQVYCVVHRLMRGKVTVRPKQATVPSGAAQKARAARERASDLLAVRRTIRQARSASRRGTQVLMPGRARLSILDFFPKAKRVAPGTVVTFRMTGRNEFHTVTFGPSAFLDDLQQRTFEAPPDQPLDPEGAFRSDPPPSVPDLTPTTHGNGFLNSGILSDPGNPGPPSFRVRFTTPGDYGYRCLIHPDMRGRITVA